MAAEATALRVEALPAASRTLCVATWNIHRAVGADGRYAPTRIVDVLFELGADLVALQ
jgi:endonuclease/exonuclease/phosphatase family metal-dependent hydrolase